MTDTQPRRPGSPPASFVDVQSIRPIANVGEKAAPPAPAPRGGREGRPTYHFPPPSAIKAAGEVLAGRHTVALTLVAGHIPSIGFAIDYPRRDKHPFHFFLRPGEARELAELLTKAAKELEGRK
jgi:hypothetical protein